MVKVKEQDLLDKGLTQADIQEFKDTGSFSDTATAKIKETIQPTTTPSVTPAMETPAPVQPATTPIKPTETPTQVEEVKTEVTQQPVKLPEFQQQINEQLDSGKTIEEVRDTIKTSGKLDQAQFNEVDKYLVQKADEKLKKQEQMQSMDNVDSLFTAIKGGSIVPEELKTSSNYTEAKKRFDTYNMYSSMTDAQLSASIGNGNILPGTKVYEDLIKDPIQKARIEKIQKYNIITGKTPKTEDVFINKSNEIINNTAVTIGDSKITLKQALDDGYISENELNSMTNNSQIITKAKEVEELKNEYDAKLRDYKNLAKTIEKELKGTGATQTDIATAVAMAQEKLLPGLQELESRTNNALGTLTQMKADSAQLFATNLSLYNQDLARQQKLQDTQSARDFEMQQTADQRKFQKEMTQEERAYNQAQADKELQQKYDYTYGDINSQDPRIRNIAITNGVDELMNTYAKQGFVFQKSKADMIDEVNQAVSQGQTLGQALTTISQRVQSSNRYKELTKPKLTESWAKLSDGSLYNQTTGEIKSIENIGDTGGLGDLRSMASQFPGQAWVKNNNPAGITWNANFDAGKGTAALLKEAGINYTKGTSRPASEGGNYVSFDTIEDGLKAQRIIMTQTYGNSTVEQMLGKWVGTGEALNYAKQVAGNAGIDLKTKVSDLSEQEVSQLQLSKIKKESPGLFKVLTETQADKSEFNATDIRTFNDLTPSEKSKKQKDPKFQSFVEAQNEVYSNPDADINDILKYSAGAGNLGETSIQQLSKFNQALSQVGELSKKINTETTGPIIGRLRNYNPYDANAQALKAEINSLIPNIARGVYGEVGVLTDADVEQYRKTLPNLQSTEDTNKLVLAMTLKTMMNGYKGQLQSLAGAGKDVSKLQGKYAEYEKTVNSLLNSINKGSQTTGAMSTNQPQNNGGGRVIKSTGGRIKS